MRTTPYADPAMVLIYGDSGRGKSVACGYAAPNALFIAAPRNLLSIETTCGYRPAQVDALTLPDLVKILLDFESQGVAYDAVVVDDLIDIVNRTLSMIVREATPRQLANNFYRWAKAREMLYEFRDVASRMNTHIFLNCWEAYPKYEEKGPNAGRMKARGGPALQSKLAEDISTMCSLVLRVGVQPGKKPHPGIFQFTESGAEWITKDRYHICRYLNPIPMNLGEILRCAGKHKQKTNGSDIDWSNYQLSRRKDLPWQEEMVEKTSHVLEAIPAPDLSSKIEELYGGLRKNGISHPAAQWTMQDALDRMIIRRALTQGEGSFFA